MFEYAIMNPPFGKTSSLSKKVLSTIHNPRLVKKIICLATPHLFKGLATYIEDFTCNLNRDNIRTLFQGSVSISALAVCKINTEVVNKYLEPADYCLDDKRRYLWKATVNYNKTHKPFYKSFGRLLLSRKEDKIKDLDESLIFLVPHYTPQTSNGVAYAGRSYEHNVLKKEIKFGESSSDISFIYFPDGTTFENFSKWWYSCGRRKEKSLLNFIFDNLLQLYFGDPKITLYLESLPNLDWTREWTDDEIIKELKEKSNLPENWVL